MLLQCATIPSCGFVIFVLAGALGALALMTVLSAAAGFALPNLLPRVYTHYASVVLFFVFGVKLLRDAREMSGGASDELEEVEAELNKADKKKNPDIESGAFLGEQEGAELCRSCTH